MTRGEIVLLVSRAIAVLQLIEALFAAIFSLPPVILLSTRALTLPVSESNRLLQETQLWLLVARIAARFFIAWLFWNCGPFIERLLAPKVQDSN